MIPSDLAGGGTGIRLDHAPAFCLSMIFSENRYPLFRIMPNKQKGSGTPAGALVQTSAPYGRGSREASRARLTAFHHGACCSDRTPQLSSRTRFLGRGAKRAL